MTWASAASADVKMVATMSGKMMGRTPSGQTVTYIKGNRMRTDQALGGNELSTIMDVDAGELISINHKKKEAEIWNVAEMARTLQAAGVAADGVKVSMKPNGQTKTVAGYPAVGHDLDVSVQSSMAQGMTMTVNISGPAFLSTEAPGAKDYAAFYLNAAEKGFFFGDPRAARAQPGNAKGMMTLYKTMAEKGVPLESMQVIKLSGDGPMAGVFAKMGGGEMNTTVTSISDEPIDDAVFAVPAGYTVKRQKVE
ncbi:hypothetical protein TBR22_A52760 [Luteitalea sp. TBR-22]|nr:hypothetical protein TBR22_A52760 [Luteitalea sp. TBR-22]